MNIKFLAAIAAFGIGAVAHAQDPVELGQIDLYYVNRTSDNGPFEWSTGPGGTGTDVFTYCFSLNNDFNPSDNPQVYNVWSITGTDVADTAFDNLVATNNMSGLTPANFLEAAAETQHFGTPGITALDDTHNDDIHYTESNGGYSYSPSDTFSNFLYLQQADTDGEGGQPQAFLGSYTPGHLNPVPEPFTMTLGIAGVGLAVRRRLAKKSA